ncbi:MAG: hypothetical protein VX272_10080 [Planctomycetota bacterium]|nr:hypothetical protein [Planctomycetota bacterium]MEC8933833.1 hypothetical protein [Planctomycetota bacterium]MEE3231369.1 hypothetical protein [Planctomycetota bacterium]
MPVRAAGRGKRPGQRKRMCPGPSSQAASAIAELPERPRLNTCPPAKIITTPPLLESEKDRLPDNSIVEV